MTSLRDTFSMLSDTKETCEHCGATFSAERIAELEARVNPFDGSQNYCSAECHEKANEAKAAKLANETEKRNQEHQTTLKFSKSEYGQ